MAKKSGKSKFIGPEITGLFEQFGLMGDNIDVPPGVSGDFIFEGIRVELPDGTTVQAAPDGEILSRE